MEKKAGELIKEVHEFKDKCEMLYKRHFPTLFDGNGYLYSKESLMKFLIEIRNDQKGFGEEDHALEGKYNVN